MSTQVSGFTYAMPIPWSKAFSHALKNGAPALARHIATTQHLRMMETGDIVNASKWYARKRTAESVTPFTMRLCGGVR